MLSQKQPTSTFNLPVGSRLVGKWGKQPYLIKKKLGQGAIGVVYLVEKLDGQLVALKMSDQIASLTSEINVLKKLAKVQGMSPGPSLFEIDDWISPRGDQYPFYTMEYVEGERLESFLRKRGVGWLGVFFSQLLLELDQLHEAGFVLGDLKLDNVIVTKNPTRLRFIDVGGVTQFGRSVKEYTEFYDRGYWRLGDRQADPKYDLFSLGMMAINYAYPKQFSRTNDPKRELFHRLKEADILKDYHHIIKRALKGSYQSCQELRTDLHRNHLSRLTKNKSYRDVSSPYHEQSWIELVLFTIISFISIAFTLFM